MKITLTREFYIPTGAIKVAAKASDAVAYLYTGMGGRPGAMLFIGKQAKPVWNWTFRNEALREQRIMEGFKTRELELNRKAAIKAEEKAKGSGLVKGDILVSSWGYDQTNVDFYEVTATHGKNSVTICQIAKVSQEDGFMTGHCVPQSGAFIGEPMRKIARDGRVMIASYASATKWNTATVAGVPVGRRERFSSYA